MADLSQVEQALIKADAAGDVAGATVLANEVRRLRAAPKDYKAMQVVEPADPTADMSFLEKFNAGAGKALTDLWEGGKQLVGAGPNAQAVRSRAELDAPLMRTGAGLAGNIGTNLAMLAPAMLAPGAATVPAAGAIGATTMALQPTENPVERLKNMGLGFGLGAGSQFAGTAGANLLGQKAAEQQAAAQTARVQNAVRDKALAAGREAGLVVPPSTINPTLANSMIESVGGKIATQQQFSAANQKVFDELGRKGIGLQPNAPVTEQILGNMRKAEGQAYEAVKKAGVPVKADPEFVQSVQGLGGSYPAAAQELPEIIKNPLLDKLKGAFDQMVNGQPISTNAAVEAVKSLRRSATDNFKAFGDPEKLALARAQRSAAEALDDLLERNLVAAGKGDIATAYQTSRVNIAKLHDAEAALTPGGHFDARVIARISEKHPVSGEFKTIADFAGNFPKAAQTGEAVGSPAVHALRPSIGSAVGGTIGGVPGAVIGGAAGVAVPWAARQAMMSKAGQAAMATPSYSPGLLGNAASAGLLPSPQTAGLLSRTAIPAIYMGLMQ